MGKSQPTYIKEFKQQAVTLFFGREGKQLLCAHTHPFLLKSRDSMCLLCQSQTFAANWQDVDLFGGAS